MPNDELSILASLEEQPQKLPTHPQLHGITGPWPLRVLDRHTAEMWLQLDEELEPEPLSDLEPLHSSDHEIGSFIEESGLGSLLRAYGRHTEEVEGHLVGFSNEQWALEQGLIPGQPFRARLRAEYYVSRAPEGDEGDCRTSAQILEIRPAPAETAAAYWEQWAQAFQAEKRQIAAEVAFGTQTVNTHPELLYVRPDWFWAEGYDDCTPPSALRLTLLSAYAGVRADGTPARGPRIGLASAESRRGDWEDAWTKLAETVAHRVPQFAHVNLRQLPHHSHQVRRSPFVVPDTKA